MKLIIGLWNPWDKYENTRHNIWFIALDKIVWSKWSFLDNSKFSWQLINIELNWEKVICLKPMTYMNLSWDSVSKLMNFYKISPKDILVIYDDIDLDTWVIRFREEWSSWWHNWVSDIIRKIWTDKFDRIKIGIGRPVHKSQVSDYVLGNFKKEELEKIWDKRTEIENHINKFLSK